MIFDDILIAQDDLCKANSKIYDQKFLIIIAAFKQWRHDLKNNFYSIKILFDHNNFKKLIIKKKLNLRQARWVQVFAIYDLKIFYHLNNKNSAISRWLDYKKISSLKITLLSTLQNKLALSSNEKLLMQSERKNSIELIFVLQLTEVSIRFDAKF